MIVPIPYRSGDCTPLIRDAILSFPADRILTIELAAGYEYEFLTKVLLSRPVIFSGAGARIIASVPNDFCFHLLDADSTYTERYEFHGIEFKWGGAFGANTSGAFNAESANNLVIDRCIGWGLGKPFVRIGQAINADITRNIVREHLNTSDIIESAGMVYCLGIKKNFLAFAAGEHQYNNVTIRNAFNLEARENACEVGKNGLSIAPYGAINSGSVENNFFEGSEVGLRLGTENGDGYYGFIRGVKVGANVFTSCGTGILGEGVIEAVDILGNRFDKQTTTAIAIPSPRISALTIGPQFFEQPESQRVVGCAYPSGVSCIDADKVVIDRADELDWVSFYNPSGMGAMSLGRGLPGQPPALQMSFSGTPTDQYTIQKSIPAVDLSAVETLVVPMYVDDPAKLKYTTNTDLSKVTRVLSLGTDAGNYWGWNLQLYSNGKTQLLKPGWNILVFRKADAHVVAGMPLDWSAITYLQLRVQPALSTDAPVVRFGGIFGFKPGSAMDFAVPQTL